MTPRILVSLLVAIITVFPLQAKPPNFIIIFTDDQGYADLGCFGSELIETPNLDRLAAQGTKFTNFHVASSVCSPSRAALLTGCYPKRVGLHKHVIFPPHTHGLNPEEITIADVLKSKGYATACVGKWHLGHEPPVLPRAHGFDSYFGIPYSNDMSHPDNKGKPKNSRDLNWTHQDEYVKQWNTPLIENEEIVELPVNQRTITRRYTDRAISFITENKEKPFFLYLPHSMPHIPLFVPKDVYDPNPANAYTCVIEHIDAEIGRIMQTLKELDLEKDTYVIFTSDNGPWLQFKNHGGSAGTLRAGKGTTYEGGQRVPCIVRGPRVPAGRNSDAFLSTMDLLPTIATLAGAAPAELKIDGKDQSAVLTGDSPSKRSEMIYYTSRGELKGIRQGDWKLLLPIKNAKGKTKGSPELYNLRNDLGEKTNLAAKHADKVDSLSKRMRDLDREITKNARPVWKKP